MSVGTIALWAVALALGVAVWVKHGRSVAREALRHGVHRALSALPRIAVAVLLAGFAGQLIPSELVAHHIGPDSGFSGVMVAMLVGGVIPGGPSISFPLVVVLNEAGAGLVQLVALVTAWSVFAIHRVVIYEIPMMGWRFSMVRLLSSLPLPLLAAGLAQLLLNVVA